MKVCGISYGAMKLKLEEIFLRIRFSKKNSVLEF